MNTKDRKKSLHKSLLKNDSEISGHGILLRNTYQGGSITSSDPLYRQSEASSQYSTDIPVPPSRPTTTVLLDAFLDTTINRLESTVKNLGPFVFAEKPEEVLHEEYEKIETSLRNSRLERLSERSTTFGDGQNLNDTINNNDKTSL